MGIHAKYMLTKYAFQNTEPKCYYSCDSYQVIWSSHATDLELKHSFETWQEARNYIDATALDDFYDDFGLSVIGLVYN